MTFLIAHGQSHVLKFNLLFQLNITEAKFFFDLTGFEPRTSGCVDQHPNHKTTEAFNIPVLHYKYEIGVRYCIYVLTLVEHLSSL